MVNKFFVDQNGNKMVPLLYRNNLQKDPDGFYQNIVSTTLSYAPSNGGISSSVPVDDRNIFPIEDNWGRISDGRFIPLKTKIPAKLEVLGPRDKDIVYLHDSLRGSVYAMYPKYFILAAMKFPVVDGIITGDFEFLRLGTAFTLAAA